MAAAAYAGQRATAGQLGRVTALLTTGSVTNSSSETTIGTFSAGYPANDGAVSGGYLFYVTGTFDTTGTPTLELRLYMASVAAGNRIWDSGALATGGTNTVQPFWIRAFLLVTATGSSGTFDAGGDAQGANWNAAAGVFSNFTASAIDTTATHDIVLTAKYSAASSSNTCRTTAGSALRM
ncbi:MAG TPA: hypothetical protein VIX86_20610 [Streptosporangiaceae bacterium]